MKFILNKQIKYYTKETFKWLNRIAIALIIIMIAIFIKYKPAYSISIAGEHIGYVNTKSHLEEKIQEIIEKEGTQNIAYIDIQAVPEYQFTLINKNFATNEEQIIAKIEESAQITYKYYAVTIDEKQESIVNTLEEAESLITEMKKKYAKVNVNFGISELYTQNIEEYKSVDVKVAKEEVSDQLKQIEDASVNGVYLAQKPITGYITSRFGSRESIRSYPHTGLDIAAPYATPIKSASEGKVTWSGTKGSYGNLIIINCGNGVEIYYGHCSKLYAKVGQNVKPGDVIAAVGSTGRSTGNHLHFEIRVNGKQVNPQNYIYTK